ncbi:hypothetical protein Pmani_000891 [Petrolisthes manimaculis]|uniref:Uncharacterized protein n=1 Tax=Petrolisthes manimaculis TaxID=1843537 RepID=A0AAE1QLU4_9EUCA|nr:hypothetical protein Pmani_000891 [Petrolisthes manimaculis]
MNGCWKKLWKECVNDFAGFKVKDTSEVRMDIMRLSHLAGFKEVNEDDIQELLDSHDEPLTNEDLMQLEQERAHNEDDDANKEEETVRGLDPVNICHCQSFPVHLSHPWAIPFSIYCGNTVYPPSWAIHL